jgi:O-antigen/teichoic acid export membrane protein
VSWAGHRALASVARLRWAAPLRELFQDSLMRNSAMLFLAAAELAAGGFLFWQVVAHLYSPDDVGRASVLISSSTLIASLALLGMNNSLIRYLPEWPDRSRTVNSGMTLVVAAAAVGAVGLALGVWTLTPNPTIVASPLEVAAFVGLSVAAAVNTFNDNVFIALRRTGYVLTRNGLVVVLRLMLPLALLAWNGFGAFVGYWLPVALALPLYFVVLRRSFGLRSRLAVSTERVRAMWRYSAGNYLATAILTMPTLLMPAVVAHRLQPAAAAYYYIASLIAGVLLFVPQATARSFFAEVTHDPGRLREHLRRVLRLTAAVQVPLAILLVALGRLVLRLFGPDYVQAYGLLVLLVLTLALSSVGFLGSTLLLATGRIRLLCLLSVVACAFSLGGAYLLMPRGLVWSGWSLLAGEAVLTTGYGYLIARTLGRGAAPAADGRPVGSAGVPEATRRSR